jgi:hypothetical protein
VFGVGVHVTGYVGTIEERTAVSADEEVADIAAQRGPKTVLPT